MASEIIWHKGKDDIVLMRPLVDCFKTSQGAAAKDGTQTGASQSPALVQVCVSPRSNYFLIN